MNANFAVSTQYTHSLPNQQNHQNLPVDIYKTDLFHQVVDGTTWELNLLQEAPLLYTLTPQTSVVCRNETREGIIPTYFTTIGLRNMYMKVKYHMPKLLVFTNLWTIIIKIIENRSLLIDKVNRVKNDKKDRTVWCSKYVTINWYILRTIFLQHE